MNIDGDSALSLIALIQRKAPEFLDLLTASSDSAFEEAFDAILEKAISNLETSKKKYQSLDEDGLSSILAAGLAIPCLSVVREANSNGHVDITIVADHTYPLRKKLVEAKIYDGPVYHVQGLTQLIDRYSTGREGRGLVVAYVKKRNIKVLMDGIREHMDSCLPCDQQGITYDHTLKWSFLSRHRFSSGDALEVGHIGCNLYID